MFFCISRKINVLFSGYLDLCFCEIVQSMTSSAAGRSRHLVRPAADDDFFISRNVRVDKCLCCQADVRCVLQLMMIFLYVETYVWTSACVAKPTSGASCSWWWLFYMSKCTCGQVLVLQSRRLVCATADDDFVKLLYSLQNCVIWRKIIFYCHHNYEKSHSKLFKN